ncbi:MAG: winged helix-turn-helix domain-containing protein [Candidatus Woesearchaeota archaeon]
MLSIPERKLIVKLHRQGKKQVEISQLVGCAQSVVHRWISRNKVREDFASRPKSGRPTKLKQSVITELKTKLKNKIEQKNAQFGSITTKEIREFIHQEIGELYSIRHVERIMHKMGFSLITPRTMHTKHDQKAADTFREEFKKKGTLHNSIY